MAIEYRPELTAEERLNMAMHHITIEAQQLGKFLPDLYAEYADKEDDAD